MSAQQLLVDVLGGCWVVLVRHQSSSFVDTMRRMGEGELSLDGDSVHPASLCVWCS
jgi:hypothetical protein